MSTTIKPVNQKAWFLVLPVLICVAFSAILPLMVVVNYSVQDIISLDRRVFVGTEWFAAIMRDEELHGALLRQLIYSFSVDARHRLEVFCGSSHRLAFLADSLECGRHDLADLWPYRHWTHGRRPARHGD
jgi:hypothetical protein